MSDNNLGVKDEFFESMLADFLDESGELLEQLNENLLQLDEWANELQEGESARCDETLLNEMFRAAHSFKGLSGMLGLDDINQLTHKVENVFDAARSDELPITTDVVELIFQSVDRLVGMVERLKDPSAAEVDCESVLEDIQCLLQGAGAERKKATQEEAEESFEAAFQAAKEAQTTSDDSSESPLESSEDYFAGIEDDDEISPKYLSIFIDETESSLDDLTEKLLASFEDNNTDSMLTVCHRIKGSAASVGLNRAAKLAHYMEDLLQELQLSGDQLTPEMADAMLKCSDALRSHTDDLRQGAVSTIDFNGVCLELLAAQTTGKPASQHPEQAQPSSELSDGECEPNDAIDESQDVHPGLLDDYLSEISSAAPHGLAAHAVQVGFRKGLPLVGLKARLAYEKLAQLGQVFYCQPADEDLDELENLEQLTLGVATEETTEGIYAALKFEGVEHVELKSLENESKSDSLEPNVNREEPKEAGIVEKSAGAPDEESCEKQVPKIDANTNVSKTPQKERPPASTGQSAKPAETVRVDIDRLDQLMNLAGQLVINKARFAQIGDSLKHLTASKQSSYSLANVFGTLDRLDSTLETCSGKSQHHHQVDFETIASHARRIQADLQAVQREVDQFKEMRSSVNELLEAVHQLDRVSDGIQKSVMDTRMVPIGPLFGRFKRVIRDITRDNGKDIQLVINGEKTELDKRMIDELGDPLIHMIRNCADHGIESPEKREASGKPRQGTVTLDAFHRGNSILIQVKDDGKGLDANRIRAKAIQKEIISETDADRLTQHQMFQLIWEPGLSTAEKVTQVSGRGMGMDIVRSKIEELSGTVELDSEVGSGTTITIKLPLTLAILPSLLADIDGDVFAVPVESVVEIVRVPKKDLASVHGLTTACVRGRIISVVRLSNLFTWNRPPASTAHNDDDDVTLVVAGSEGQEIGLIVHELLGEEDIVIKSLAENYRNVDGVAGASILGDGRVSLILDVGALLESASSQSQATTVS